MKKLMLLACFAMVCSVGFSQIKVVTTGAVKVGDTNTAPLGALHVTGTSTIEFGLDAAAGNPDFTLLEAGVSKAQFKYNRNANRLEILADDANTGNAGLTSDKSGITINGNTRAVAVGKNNAQAGIQLDVAGAIGYNGTLTNTSDKRLKDNVSSFEYGLDQVLAIDPIYYSYTGEANTPTEGTHVGLMAQELQKIAPNIVGSFTHEEWKFDSTGEGKDQLISSKEYLNVQESAIKYMLINAIKAQQELIEKQSADIAELKEIVSGIGSVDGINRSEVTLNIYDLAELGDNSPNPFNGVTNIDYIIPSDAKTASMNIIGLNGQVMKTVSIDHVGEGILTVNADDIPSGTYTYQLIVDGRNIATKKMVIAQ